MSTIQIISKRTFRFKNPGVDIYKAMSGAHELPFKEAYFETIPGPDGRFGEPQEAPGWIKNDAMWEWAVKDGNICEVQVAPMVAHATSIASQIEAAGKIAAGKQAEKATEDLNHKQELEAMTKAQLVDYALETCGLELDAGSKKDELIAAILDAEGGAPVA